MFEARDEISEAIIQNLNLTNGSEGKTIGVFLQIRDGYGLPATFQMVLLRDEYEDLEETLAALNEFMVEMDYISIISNPEKTDFIDGGLIIDAPKKNKQVLLRGPRWNRVF